MPSQPASNESQRDARMSTEWRAGVVVPIRSFRFGNMRLASVLDDDARVALARRMADTVVAAAAERALVIISSAPEVARWCTAHDLPRLDDPGSLDAAAAAGQQWVRDQGWARVVVVHGDLPFAASLDDVANDGAARVAVLVPDHRGDGTPVISVPVDVTFPYAYGPGSFARHVSAAEGAGLAVRVVRDHALGFDVDVPEDLARLESPTP
jgi:2-phospho-L-lactate guanylyltransferase